MSSNTTVILPSVVQTHPVLSTAMLGGAAAAWMMYKGALQRVALSLGLLLISYVFLKLVVEPVAAIYKISRRIVNAAAKEEAAEEEAADDDEDDWNEVDYIKFMNQYMASLEATAYDRGVRDGAALINEVNNSVLKKNTKKKRETRAAMRLRVAREMKESAERLRMIGRINPNYKAP